MSKRGRKPTPCPDYDELRRLVAEDPRPTIIRDRMGVSYQSVIRWLAEIGIEHKKVVRRQRGAELLYTGCARSAVTGKKLMPKLYSVWHSMRNRCRLPTHGNYAYYGGRGIRVCEAWNDYHVFREWSIRNGYRNGLTLDRIDVNGHYEPDNCRWRTRSEQQLNSRRSIEKRARLAARSSLDGDKK